MTPGASVPSAIVFGDGCRLQWVGTAAESVERDWATADVLYNLQKTMPASVWETSVLEGIVITIPEVTTLMEGMSIEGRPLNDVNQVNDIAEAYRMLGRSIRDDAFAMTKEQMDAFNAVLERHEILDPGRFRLDGTQVRSPGGEVSLLDGSSHFAPHPGDDAAQLKRIWDEGSAQIERIDDPVERAFALFAFIVYNQFYYNGNKRTAKFMMNGVLMSNGINAVNPTSRTREGYYSALDVLFREADATPIINYLAGQSKRYRSGDVVA